MPSSPGSTGKIKATDKTSLECQEERLRVVHEVIHEAAIPVSVKAIIELISKTPARWPEAPWAGARKGLPDYQQIVNICHRLRGLEFIEQQGRQYIFIAKTAPPPRKMRRRAEEALRLKAEGKNGVEIAEIMGISRSLAYNLINDPHGHKERERKKGYCPVCGGKKDPSVEWCRKCKMAKVEDLLPTPDYLAIARRIEEERGMPVVFGVTQDYERVIRVGTKRGVWEYKLRRNESWDDALEEMDLV